MRDGNPSIVPSGRSNPQVVSLPMRDGNQVIIDEGTNRWVQLLAYL